MAITNFVSKLWSSAVLVPFNKNLVYCQPTIANRDYEGMIREQGDTVNITSISAPTISGYDKGSDISIEDVSDANIKLVIDQGDYFAFRVNDLDRVQAAGEFAGPALTQAGIKLRDKVDQFAAKTLAAGVAAANKVAASKLVPVSSTAPADGEATAFGILNKLREKLDLVSAPSEGRYAVIPAEFLTFLLDDLRFTRVDASGSSEGLRNGLVGRALGMDILVSPNVPLVGGAGTDKNNKVVIAGVPAAFSFANQLTEVEAIREQARFADVVRGLNIYGAKVTRPEALASASVSF